MIDDRLVNQLNLIRLQPSFVYHAFDDESEQVEILKLDMIPASTGVYWVAGTTILRCGDKVESVFCVDTDAGGELSEVYWWVDGDWYASDDPEASRALNRSRQEVFPFNWEFKIPLEEDRFH